MPEQHQSNWTLVKDSLKSHSLFYMNILMLLMLVYGLAVSYGGSYLGQLSIYVVTFIAAYFLLNKWTLRKAGRRSIHIPEKIRKFGLYFLIAFVAVFQVIHYYYIGNVPIIKAMMSTDYYHIAQIRQDIKSVNSSLVNYSSAFVVKSVIPVLLYLLYWRDKKLFWLFFLVAGFYALALMQKAFIVTALIPLVLGLLLERKWWRAGFYTGVAFGGIMLLFLVTNPILRPYPFHCDPCVNSAPEKDLKNDDAAAVQVSDALYKRIFVLGGEMVGNWFYYVPDSLPYLKGDGYRLVARAKGIPQRDYAREIYDKLYPVEASMGFTGTATTAYFMYDYANFGMAGLAVAAIYLALFLIIIKRFFRNDFRSMLTLNSIFLFWISCGAFTTVLFSGGWILTILLYWFYRPYFARQTDVKHA